MTSKELHNRAFVLDSHCDTPSRIWEGYPYTEKNTTNHVDFDKLFKGGVDASFFAIYTSNLLEPDAATRKALQLIAATYDAVYKYPGKAAIAHSVQGTEGEGNARHFPWNGERTAYSEGSEPSQTVLQNGSEVSYTYTFP